jgi:hypothetical protein
MHMGTTYKIVEAQLPVVGGLGGHDLLVLEDPNGNVIGELDGLATGSNGQIKPIGYLPSDTLKVYSYSQATYYTSSEPQATVSSGTQQQIMAEWNAAIACGNAINAEGLSYPFLGIGDNSNSVASTLDSCMGAYEPTIPGSALITPGVGVLLLPPATIQTIEQQNGVSGGPGTTGDNYVSSDNSSTSSNPSVTVTNGDGSTAVTTFSTSNGSGVADLKDDNLGGTLQYEQINITASNGQVTSSVSGQGDIVNLGGATITLSTGASATVQANNDVITVSSGASATVNGNSDTTILNLGALSANIQGNNGYISDGNGIGFTSSGVSDQVNIGGYYLGQATASFTSSTSLDSIKLSNNNILNVANGSQDTITAGDSTLTANNNSTGNGNVQNTINWNSGGSQGQYFTEQPNGSALASGTTDELLDYLGSNLTGTLHDGIVTYNMQVGPYATGSSEETVYSGLASGVSTLAEYFSTANATGTEYQINTNYNAGNSQVEFIGTASGLPANIATQFDDTTANNGGGTDTENILNWTAGGSQEQLFTGLPNGVTADYYGYSGSNLTGTQQSQQVVNAANGNGQVWVVVSGTGATCSLNNDYIQLSGNATCTITGQNDSIILTGGCTVNVTGSSDTVSCQSGNWNTVDLNGSSDTATLNGTHETVDSTVSGDTINLSGSNGTWDTVDASHDTVNLGTQDDLSLTGNTNTIVGSYDVMDFSGTYNALNTSYSVISDFNTAGDWLTGYYDMYDGTNESGYYNGADPIVLNLSGQQVQTVGIAQSGAFFDMQNDGQKILTGWASAGEGFLVYDPNNTSAVTNEGSLVSSFSALQALDSNHDGVLNASDAAWSKLKVWVDAAGIGNYSSSSLYTLAQLGITSINLNAAQESQNSNGNTIVADSTFTFANGSTGDISGVNFVNAPDITMGVNGAIFQQANNAYNQLVSAMAAAPPVSSASAAVIASSQYAASIASLAPPSTVGAH